MKKTIREWFETLPEPYRSQALENIDENFEYYKFYNDKCENVKSAVFHGFQWMKSPQDFHYWSKFFATLEGDVNWHNHNKSNRQIAEEIANEFSSPVMNPHSEQQDIINKIESILNKYFNR